MRHESWPAAWGDVPAPRPFYPIEVPRRFRTSKVLVEFNAPPKKVGGLLEALGGFLKMVLSHT